MGREDDEARTCVQVRLAWGRRGSSEPPGRVCGGAGRGERGEAARGRRSGSRRRGSFPHQVLDAAGGWGVCEERLGVCAPRCRAPAASRCAVPGPPAESVVAPLVAVRTSVGLVVHGGADGCLEGHVGAYGHKKPRGAVFGRRLARGPEDRHDRGMRALLVILQRRARVRGAGLVDRTGPQSRRRRWPSYGSRGMSISARAGQGRWTRLAAAMGGASGVVNLEGPIDGRGRAGWCASRERFACSMGQVRRGAGARGHRGGRRWPTTMRTMPVLEGQAATDARAADGRSGAVRRDGGSGGDRARRAAAWHSQASSSVRRCRGAAAGAGGGARRPGTCWWSGFTRRGRRCTCPSRRCGGRPSLALEAGAAVVVAHGSHSLAGAELRGLPWWRGASGTPTFACDCTEEREALALRVRLGRGGVGVGRAGADRRRAVRAAGAS